MLAQTLHSIYHSFSIRPFSSFVCFSSVVIFTFHFIVRLTVDGKYCDKAERKPNENERERDDEWKTLEKLSKETSSNLKMMDSRKSCWKFNFRYFSFRLCVFFLVRCRKVFFFASSPTLVVCTAEESRPSAPGPEMSDEECRKIAWNRAGREKKGEIERIKVGFFEISLPRAFKFSFLKLLRELSSFPFLIISLLSLQLRDFKHESRGNWKISHLSTAATRNKFNVTILSYSKAPAALLMAESNYFEIKQNKYVLSGASQSEMNVQRHQERHTNEAAEEATSREKNLNRRRKMRK